MNSRLISVFFTSALLLFTSSVHLLYADSIVIRGVHLLTMENQGIVSGQTLIIEDGIIIWVGDDANADVPEGAKVISGEWYVMPGLAEMHAHIPPASQGTERVKATLGLYLSQGVTTIRGMLGDPLHLEMREMAREGEIMSPRIFTSGPSFNGNSATDPATTRQMVREQAAAGYDLLKFHPGITLENFEAATEEANRIGIEFSGHISIGVGLERTLASGKGTIDHLDRYMEFLAGEAAEREDPPIIFFGYDLTPYAERSRMTIAAEMTRAAGVWNVPTNTLLENVFNPDYSIADMMNWPGMEYIAEQTKVGWSNYVNLIRNGEAYNPDLARDFLNLRKEMTYALHQAGAGLLLGADAPQIFNPPGFSVHRELALLTEAGLTPWEAIKTGTVNVGVYLGEEETTGKIAPGFRSDLLLLSENPLESIPFNSYIEGVIIQGIYLSRTDLDEMLEEIQEILNP
ncbi:MAG: amidohydrolase [Balneolaceae bacterium]|nr:MAG: amidohydrolase [Balneolaceae bacterium]